jgi:hypothetical protein
MEDSHVVLRSVADISKFLYKLGLILGVLYLMSLKKKTSAYDVLKSFWVLFAVL